MPLRTRRFAMVAIVAVFLAVNIVAMRWWSGFLRRPGNVALLRYGAHIPKLKGQSLLEDKSVELSPSLHNLIIYFSSATAPGLSIELIKYGEILTQHFGKNGLKVTTIVPGDVPELRGLIQHSLINYDLVIDPDHQIGDQLGLASRENGVFLFDNQGLCRFATRRPIGANDLRQLIAVEFLRIDPFKTLAPPEQTIRQGAQLGSWSLLDVRSWEQTSLSKIRGSEPTLFVFFTAECSVCSLPDYLEKFTKFEQREKSASAIRNVLVFDFNFSANDVIEQLKTHNISTPAYIVSEQLPTVEEMVQDETLKQETVVALETDKKGNVVNISSLKSPVGGGVDGGVSGANSQPLTAATNAMYEEVFNHIPLSGYDVASYQGKYILSDFKRHRVLVVDDNMEVEKEFGGIGSGPGRLFHPGSLDVTRDGVIYVQDGGNERIAEFTLDGKHLGDLPLHDYEGLAAGAHDELYLGVPEEGHLVTTYSTSGKKLRSFGQLKKFSEFYGPEFSEKDAQYRIAFNRVRMSTDTEGNLYVSFMLAPILQKYTPSGDLLFERRLEDPGIDHLLKAIQKRKYVSTGSDGADARIVAIDPVVEPHNGNILVPLIDGSIYVADRDGNKVKFLHPHAIQTKDDLFYPFAAGLGAKGELLVSPFPRKQWYRLVMPNDSAGKVAAAIGGNEPTDGQ